MNALKQRLRRAEKTLRVGDLDAELEKLSDDELEDRIQELTEILQREADARGVSLDELRAELDAHFMDEAHPQPRWSSSGWVWS